MELTYEERKIILASAQLITEASGLLISNKSVFAICQEEQEQLRITIGNLLMIISVDGQLSFTNQTKDL